MPGVPSPIGKLEIADQVGSICVNGASLRCCVLGRDGRGERLLSCPSPVPTVAGGAVFARSARVPRAPRAKNAPRAQGADDEDDVDDPTTASWVRSGLGCAMSCALLLSGCSDDDAPARDARVVDARARDASRRDAAVRDAAARDAAVRDAAAVNPFNTVAAVKAFFDGKTVVMEGSNIPTHPQGANENMNLGPAATQCLHKVTIKLNEAPQMVVTTELGTLNGAPTVGSVGTCDRTTKLGEPFAFTTTSVVIENVAARTAAASTSRRTTPASRSKGAARSVPTAKASDSSSTSRAWPPAIAAPMGLRAAPPSNISVRTSRATPSESSRLRPRSSRSAWRRPRCERLVLPTRGFEPEGRRWPGGWRTRQRD